MTKPTVKGGLAPANAVVCEGKGAGARSYPGCIWTGPIGPRIHLRADVVSCG